MFRSFFDQYKVYVILAALAALVVGEFFFTRDIYVTACDLKISEISLANEKANTANLEKLRVTELELTTLKDTLEKQNVDSKEELSKANAIHTDYVRKYGLRDPGKQKSNPVSCDSGSTSNPSGSDDNNLISTAASGFLLSLTEEADRIRIDYKTCMDWMAQVKTILDKSK